MKKMHYLFCGLIFCLGVLVFWGMVSGGQAAAGGETAVALQGTFQIVWGDGAPGSSETHTAYFLITQPFGTVQLQIDAAVLEPAGGGLALNGQPVTVSGRWLTGTQDGGAFEVESLGLARQPEAVQDVVGPQPWVSVLCKFSDVPAEPKALPYFLDMYSTEYPGLDHFWSENSYGLVNLDGSGAFGWYTLPHERAYYLPGGNLAWWTIATDCAAAADADIYFPDYVGINLMFNDVLDCCAWGASWYTTLDGVTRTWRTTWEPPWGYGNVGVIAHETGHGFGLPHSNWGPTDNVYDNEWDVMSDLWANGSHGGTHPVYGVVGQHTISFHKAMLGWIPPSKIVVVNPGSIRTVTLERIALPGAAAVMAVRVPINGSENYFYTVEARRRLGNYDNWLPGDAVVIHEVQTGRGEPAHLMGTDGSTGGMWTPGETFPDATNGIQITVVSATVSGYVVTVRNQFVDITGVDLAGPALAYVEDSVMLTATVSPANASLPVNYTWQVSGQEPVTRPGTTQDVITFQWSEPGTRTITVTVDNGAASFSDVHSVVIKTLPLDVSLSGPQEILVSQPYTFTAASILNEGALPITYTWQASGMQPVTHTAGLTDVIQLEWAVTGTQTITVTARNGENQATAQHILSVLAFPLEVAIRGPEQLLLGQAGIFTATSLYDGVGPITYTWQASGMQPVTHTGELTDTAEFVWSEPGTHTITVTAQTVGFSAQDTHPVTVLIGPQSVTLEGLALVELGAKDYPVTVYVFPLTVTLPLTYAWQVDGGEVLTHTGGLSDTLLINWAAPGVHTIQVIVTNRSGVIAQGWMDVTVTTRIYLPFALRQE